MLCARQLTWYRPSAHDAKTGRFGVSLDEVDLELVDIRSDIRALRIRRQRGLLHAEHGCRECCDPSLSTGLQAFPRGRDLNAHPLGIDLRRRAPDDRDDACRLGQSRILQRPGQTHVRHSQRFQRLSTSASHSSRRGSILRGLEQIAAEASPSKG